MRSLLSLLLVLGIHATSVVATRFNFKNECPFTVELWDNSIFINIPSNGPIVCQDVARPGLMWRHGYNPEATLAEFTVTGDGRVWYDISVIPPGTGWCNSFDNCQAVSNGRKGFNVGLAIRPRSNINGANCRALTCLSECCDDAYLYPTDNRKVHNCPDSTEMDIVFCPGGVVRSATAVCSSTPTPAPTPAPTPTPTLAPVPKPTTTTRPPTPPSSPGPYQLAKFTYRGQQAGNVPGAYDRITRLAGCQKTRVNLQSPVGPLSEEVSMVFRGPMEIFNIAVFDGSAASSTSSWRRVSWYKRGGLASNLIFMNNRNIDYSGQQRYGPQIFASGTGKAASTSPLAFLGSLAEASNPTAVGGGPGIDTGVEVNILTSKKCGLTDCPGFHEGPYSYHGWGGGRKLFVTQVQMPLGRGPNVPAIWLLNTQVLYAGQYSGCNCRGMGAAGGCGELDVAEVLATNRQRISTHYYFYDGSVPSAPGGDNFASRPMNASTIYVTILDDTGPGTIKILELSSFNFDTTTLSRAQIQAWLDA